MPNGYQRKATSDRCSLKKMLEDMRVVHSYNGLYEVFLILLPKCMEYLSKTKKED